MKKWALKILLGLAKNFLADKLLYQVRDWICEYLEKRAAATDNKLDDAAVRVFKEGLTAMIKTLLGELNPESPTPKKSRRG